MKLAKNILSILILGILLFANVSKPKVCETKKTDQEKTVLLQDVSQDIVIPTFQYVFKADFILLQLINFDFISEKIDQNFVFKVVYFNTYFDKIFEKHIAINAP